MFRKINSLTSLAASATKGLGSVDCENLRSLTVTCKVKYHGSATSGITCQLKFCPNIGDSEELNDSENYCSFVPTLTAGSTITRTVKVDAPEDGLLTISVKNDDGSYAATAIEVWVTESRYPE